MYFQTQETYIKVSSPIPEMCLSSFRIADVCIILHGAVKHILIFLAELHEEEERCPQGLCEIYSWIYSPLFFPSSLSLFSHFLYRVRARYIAGEISRCRKQHLFFLSFSTWKRERLSFNVYVSHENLVSRKKTAMDTLQQSNYSS